MYKLCFQKIICDKLLMTSVFSVNRILRKSDLFLLTANIPGKTSARNTQDAKGHHGEWGQPIYQTDQEQQQHEFGIVQETKVY